MMVRRVRLPRPFAMHAGALTALLIATSLSAAAADPSELLAEAESLMRAGRDREALPVLDKIVVATPDDGTAYERRALARWRAMTMTADGDGQGFATIQARLCIETQPDCRDVGDALTDLGRAIALLEGSARGRTYAERARIQVRLGRDALALADDDEAIRLAPDDVQYSEDRAVVREHMGDGAGALADLDEVLRRRPGSGQDLVMRAELRRRNGDVVGARSDLDDALAHVPPGREPDWVEDARRLRRAVAIPDEPGMGSDSGALTVLHAEATTDANGRPAASVAFDPVSAKRLAAYTAAHIGSRIDLVVDGRVIMTRRVLSPITGGIVVISGSFSDDEVKALVERLRAPSAAVSLHAAD